MSEFEFGFGDASREQLLDEAAEMVAGLSSDLGDGKAVRDQPDEVVTNRLLDLLNGDVAEFSAYPDVVRLDREYFAERQLPIPAQFDVLSSRYAFYWTCFPVTLAAPPEFPFKRLECAIELNPDEQDAHLRPRAHSILPDRKFETKLGVDGGVDIHLGENLTFEAGVPAVGIALPVGHGSVAAAVDAKVAAKAGLVAGPFHYEMRKGLLTHSPPGTEKVVWRFDDARFVAEDDPTFVIVMQVPKEVTNVRVAAALQAYHGFSLAEAGLAKSVQYFTARLASFFRAGAPILDKRLWDVTPSL